MIYSIYQGDAWPVPDANADVKPSLSLHEEPRNDLVLALAELTRAMTRQNELLESLVFQHGAILEELAQDEEGEPTQYLDGSRM